MGLEGTTNPYSNLNSWKVLKPNYNPVRRTQGGYFNNFYKLGQVACFKIYTFKIDDIIWNLLQLSLCFKSLTNKYLYVFHKCSLKEML